ncbi:tyrosine-type recombinase/integrase [Nonomuraea basaltis]|uniref:tyrosine-type recombinase/integrase n=1 Tax=Nonomuraea basaltis TaxID=2495887 RepID=UPI00110C4750|nr:site-specific integrase [Nonomuraea basaltis]TMR95580.1 site-specific integrase [Nonomuraea basaltis]
MSVYDRWHRSRPKPDEAKCKCRPARVPSAEHGIGERWQVRYRDDAGKQRKRNFETKPAAESFEARIKASLDRGDYVDPAAGKVTLTSYSRDWRGNLTVDPATLQQIDSRLSKWVYGQPIGNKAMGLLAKRPSMVQQWIKSMEVSLLPSTIKIIVDMVSTIFTAAVEDQVIGRNPVHSKSVSPPPPSKKKVVPWTRSKVTAMAEALPGRYRAMPFLGAGCGHRQGELLGVGLEDIDFLGREIHVRRQVRLVGGRLVFSPPKRGKTRTIPLPASVALRLSAHIAEYPPVEVTLPWVERGKAKAELVTVPLLFVSSRGQAIHRSTYNTMWRGALEPAGIVPPTQEGQRRKSYPEHMCHVLRHTAASAWLAAGVDIRTVAEFLGHSDPGFTLRIYTHFLPSASDRARKAMDAFFVEGDADASSALVVPSTRSM